ncbi:MAG TPA: CAP domain-containing protein [Gallionellaceae bacterium]
MKYRGIGCAVFMMMLAAGCADTAGIESAGSTPGGTVDRAAILAAHNKWRAGVGVAKLSYSTELEASAQAWANYLKKNNHCQMRHSKPDGKYGENLYWASAIMWSDGRREVQSVAPETPVDSWGMEKSDFDYAVNNCIPGKVCGHYTQMVWRDTQKVGCAFAVCTDSKDQIWVCQYQPAGNWVGERPY